MSNRKEYDLVFLCVEKNIEFVLKNINVYKHCIVPKRIVIIGSKEIEHFVDKSFDIEFVDEDYLLNGMSFQQVSDYVASLDKSAENRSGWYFQQFLKLAYAYVCEEKNYLIWDGDTLPLHKIHLNNERKSYFDVKTEYNEAYFRTITKLFPNLEKQSKYSFISEHMLFNVDIVKKMINEINGHDSDVKDNFFWKRILDCIDIKDLKYSGFSEFETYGTYVMYHFPTKYQIRKWKSLREGTVFFGDNFDIVKYSWLGNYYDAISFETYDNYYKLNKIFGHKIFQNIVCIKVIMFFKDSISKIYDYVRRK